MRTIRRGLVAMALASIAAVAVRIDGGEALLGRGGAARGWGRSAVVGAGVWPGLSCVLAQFGSGGCEGVEELEVATVGAGGREWARRHHQALGDEALDWRDG